MKIKYIYLITGGVYDNESEDAEGNEGPSEILLYPVAAFSTHKKAVNYCIETGFVGSGDIYHKTEIFRRITKISYYS